ncbi:DUF4278 domain-containing protein [Phormidium sp. FACHB-1136]|nr:DUF4278 domain-containing protein [Phormidium sp. FACHB-1136]
MLVTLLLLLAMTCGAAIALGLVIVGFLEAPGPVLLLILCFGLVGLQRLTAHAITQEVSDELASGVQPSSTSEDCSAQSESPANNSPTFTYRGVKYSSPSSQKPDGEEATVAEGIYRGKPWRRTNTDASKQMPAPSDLTGEIKYRGHPVKK